MLPWFKTFAEARVDPKLRCLTRDEHYVWFQLLCYAAEQPERGVIESFNDQMLAHAIADGDVALLLSSLETFVRLRIVSCVSSSVSSERETLETLHETPETVSSVSPDVSSVSRDDQNRRITLLNFAKRQGGRGAERVSPGVSPDAKTSTDRVRKCRENKRLRDIDRGDPDVKRDETLNETHETRHETPEKRDETPDREGDLDLDGDLNSPPPSRVCDPGTLGGPPSTPTRTPEDQEQVREAIAILGSTMDTERVGLDLGGNLTTPDVARLAGWQLLCAAHKFVGPTVARRKRSQFSYYLGIARKVTLEEWEELRASPPPAEPSRSPPMPAMTAAQAKLHAQSIAIRNANSANNPALIAIEGE